ncbi:MAG: hypothetical protein R2705_10800 [Ilumatobacteraceae bacterium]
MSIAVDPVDSNSVFLITSSAYNPWLDDFQGIYHSADGGESWTRVLDAVPDADRTTASPSREHQENLLFDPASVDKLGARTWYATIDSDAVYRSVDRGKTWVAITDVSELGDVHNTIIDRPGQRLLLSSASGLYAVDLNTARLSPVGNLTGRHIGWVTIPASNRTTVYATVLNDGLYRAEAAKLVFGRMLAYPARSVFVHPTNASRIYLTGDLVTARVSSNGGLTWATATATPPLGLDRDTSWKRRIQGMQTFVSPDPRDPDVAVAGSRAQLWRTANSGRTWTNSSERFTGYNWRRFSSSAFFDPDNAGRALFFQMDIGMVRTDDGVRPSSDRRSRRAWSKTAPSTDVTCTRAGSSRGATAR